MNKKALATALLCFSLFLSAFQVVSALSSDGFGVVYVYDINMHPSCSTTLSLEELLVLPEYVTVNEEPPPDSTGTVYAIPIPPDGDIPPPNPAPVNTRVIVDDDAAIFLGLINLGTGAYLTLYEWGASVLEVGDDPFWTSFKIDFVASQFTYWESPNIPAGQPITNMYSLMASAVTAYGQQPSGIDVTYVLTGQNTAPYFGMSYPYYRIFIVSLWAAVFFTPLQNVWQHEASHQYYANDHADSIWCIMNPRFAYYTRDWCSGCTSRISQYRYRFD